MIAGDDWVPLRERERRRRESSTEVVGEEGGRGEQGGWEGEEELGPGEIDVDTYGLDEPDDDHPAYRGNAP